MRRNHHLHELFCRLKTFVPGYMNFLNITRIQITHRALDKISLFIHQSRRTRFKRLLANGIPKPQKIIQIALHFHLRTRNARCTQNNAHTLRYFQILHHVAHFCAILIIRNLARYTARPRTIRHQHTIAPRQRQIRPYSSTFIAALFF